MIIAKSFTDYNKNPTLKYTSRSIIECDNCMFTEIMTCRQNMRTKKFESQTIHNA